MLDRIRVGVALLFILLFIVSIFTKFPEDPGTRTNVGILALAASGFLFGPSFLRRKEKNGDS